MNVGIIGGIHELSGDLSSSAYWNDDIAPTKLSSSDICRCAAGAKRRRRPIAAAPLP